MENLADRAPLPVSAATQTTVRVHGQDQDLVVAVADDGCGGAHPDAGCASTPSEALSVIDSTAPDLAVLDHQPVPGAG